jgi:3-hydroxyisobutyrate dehydrogenase-like beta-hydroxyacid dehydrogenase
MNFGCRRALSDIPVEAVHECCAKSPNDCSQASQVGQKLMTKGLSYATGEAAGLSVPNPTGNAALGEFEKAVAAGHGEEDIAAIVEPLRKPFSL